MRLHEWHRLELWARLHAVLLARLRYADNIDWRRAAVEATTLRAARGGDKTDKTPTVRSRGGTKEPDDRRRYLPALMAAEGVPQARDKT